MSKSAIDRAEAFAKSVNTTPEEHDDIMDCVRLARMASPYNYGNDIKMPSDDALLFRAVSSARPVLDVRGGVYRWSAIMQTFQLGSTYAKALCERFRLDPDQKVRR